jgi:hypothetical protein
VEFRRDGENDDSGLGARRTSPALDCSGPSSLFTSNRLKVLDRPLSTVSGILARIGIG